ncbi:MAG: AAA family ATPase [Candidatus Pacebacteria bacterium CG10_big_fil_rev_8_21_14_0_10_44_54]|nr:replication-associated recombination protein A [Candidatus Paceibacterota bacterium]PIR60572.1 MAG: AAA family ATPase [Candidatus Pacebacteria bacterium CG10_big_fil_rev_8_21_14_0_10_44_54]
MPLANILRPNSLDEYLGQPHLIGPGKPITESLKRNLVFSMIFWGPPGVGKTTLARIIAKEQRREFYELSAVSAGKADIRVIIENERKQKRLDQSTLAPVLFLDEIHRFNKAQQDFLLPYVETGELLLIGATTENPSFEIISALLSRTKVYTLQQLNHDELYKVIHRSQDYWKDAEHISIKIDKNTKDWLVEYSAGDARKLLNTLEHTKALYDQITIENIKASLQSNLIRYDKAGEEHYDTISAFIKSMRASNSSAALYYLARMVHAGEDPKFIARRMVVFASEDIGLAAPTALVVANEVFRAVETIGYPEAQINLAHGVAYLSNCKKNRSAYDAYFAALDDVKKHGNLPIPLHLRNAPTKLMKELGYGKGYEMYPDSKESLLPEKLKDKNYFS